MEGPNKIGENDENDENIAGLVNLRRHCYSMLMNILYDRLKSHPPIKFLVFVSYEVI